MKNLFEQTEWPQMRPDLKNVIMTNILAHDFSPWTLLNTPHARLGLVSSMIISLVAGFLMATSQNAPHHTHVPITSVALAYYVRT